MVITRIVPLSCAKVAGTLYGILGIAIGAVVSVIALAGGFASDSFGGAGMGALIGVGAIVAFPLLYGCIAFVAALIVAWLYNFAAGLVGGIELEVK